jgi:hypothetical protein
MSVFVSEEHHTHTCLSAEGLTIRVSFILDTGSRPFACKVCHRAFARQDSLMRHKRLHLRQSNLKNSSSVLPAGSSPNTPESLDIDDLSDHSRIQQQFHNPLTSSSYLSPSSSTTATTPPPNIIIPPFDPNFNLIWPDSENLFQTIFSADLTTPQSLHVGTLTYENLSTLAPPNAYPHSLASPAESIEPIPMGSNQRAVQDVSKMISTLVS